MKKFVIILILLTAAAASVFFIGWLQFHIDRNQIGVVHTRTVGYLKNPVVSGEFYWTPWRLIPRNVSLITIPDEPVTVSVSQQGTLPSGSLYSYYVQGHPDFSFSISMTLTFSISADSAVHLVSAENLSSENYDQWVRRKKEAVQHRSLGLLMEHIEHIADSLSQGSNEEPSISSSTLKQDLERHFPELVIHAVSIDSLSLPDLMLYVTAREAYYQALKTQQKTLEDALEVYSSDRAELELYIQRLEKYGRLFSQYPSLLQYLELHPLDSLP